MSARLEMITGLVQRVLGWWGGELAGLVPGRLRKLAAPSRIVVSPEGASVRVIEERAGQQRALEDVGLATLAAVAAGRPVGVRLSYASCFERRVELPAAARRDAADILALDLERSTPFRAADVYQAHLVDEAPASQGKIAVRHLIVKREVLDRAVARIEAAGARLEFADCWSADGEAALAIDFLGSRDRPGTSDARPLRLAFTLGALAVALAASAIWLLVDRHQEALARLEAETQRARTQVQALRRAAGEQDSIAGEMAGLARLKHHRPAAVEVIEELTRLLPDSAHLSELRIEGDTVDISGLARSAAGLLPLLERSGLLMDAALTAPLTREPGQERERFSVRMRLKPAASAAGQGGGKG